MDWKEVSIIHLKNSQGCKIAFGHYNTSNAVVKSFTNLSKENYKLIKREAKCLKHLNHPRVVKLYGYKKSSTFDQQGKTYNIEIYMEYLGQTTLQQYVSDPCYDHITVKREIRELIYLFAYMQRKKICHKDITPFNLMFHDDKFVLIDFSEGKVIGFNNNISFRGTVNYLSPEMRKYRIDQNTEINEFVSDVWSLGLVFYYLLGKHCDNIIYDDNLQQNMYQNLNNIGDCWINKVLKEMLVVDKNERKDFIQLESFIKSICFNCGNADVVPDDLICNNCRNE